MQQPNIRNEIRIVLDREKIEREGEYDYDDLVEYLDTEFAEQGFIRQSNEECLCYCSDEPNNFLKQVVCYARVVDEPAIYNNLKSWHIAEYRNNDYDNPVMVEDCLETIARDNMKTSRAKQKLRENLERPIVTNEIKIVLDREKIECEDDYYYDDIVEFLDTEFAEQGFIRQPDEDCLCYRSDETNNLLKQAVCYKRVVEDPAVYDNLISWFIAEYENHDYDNPVMIEDVLATIAADGGNP